MGPGLLPDPGFAPNAPLMPTPRYQIPQYEHQQQQQYPPSQRQRLPQQQRQQQPTAQQQQPTGMQPGQRIGARMMHVGGPPVSAYYPGHFAPRYAMYSLIEKAC
jgi:hypothetical protein